MINKSWALIAKAKEAIKNLYSKSYTKFLDCKAWKFALFIKLPMPSFSSPPRWLCLAVCTLEAWCWYTHFVTGGALLWIKGLWLIRQLKVNLLPLIVFQMPSLIKAEPGLWRPALSAAPCLDANLPAWCLPPPFSPYEAWHSGGSWTIGHAPAFSGDRCWPPLCHHTGPWDQFNRHLKIHGFEKGGNGGSIW